jgi:hypothetical protein
MAAIGLSSTAVSCFIRTAKQKVRNKSFLKLDLTDLNRTTEADATTLRLLGEYMMKHLGMTYFIYADFMAVKRVFDLIKEGEDWRNEAASISMATISTSLSTEAPAAETATTSDAVNEDDDDLVALDGSDDE